MDFRVLYRKVHEGNARKGRKVIDTKKALSPSRTTEASGAKKNLELFAV
jgi:hypothetical protein